MAFFKKPSRALTLVSLRWVDTVVAVAAAVAAMVEEDTEVEDEEVSLVATVHHLAEVDGKQGRTYTIGGDTSFLCA